MVGRTVVAVTLTVSLLLVATSIAFLSPWKEPTPRTPSVDPLHAPRETGSIRSASTSANWSGPTCPWVPSEAPEVKSSSTWSLSSLLGSLRWSSSSPYSTQSRLPGALRDDHIVSALSKRASVSDGHYVAVVEGRAPGARPLWATHSFQLFSPDEDSGVASSSPSSSSSSTTTTTTTTRASKAEEALSSQRMTGGNLSGVWTGLKSMWNGIWTSSNDDENVVESVSGPYDGSHILRNAVTGKEYRLASPRELPSSHIFLHNGGYVDTDTVATHPNTGSRSTYARGLPVTDRHPALTGRDWYDEPLHVEGESHESARMLYWLKTSHQLSDEEIVSLESLLGDGSDISHYLPVNTYQLYTSPASLAALEGNELVHWVGAVPPGAKLADHFAATAGPTPRMRSAIGPDTHVDDIYMPNQISVRLIPPHDNAQDLADAWIEPLTEALGLVAGEVSFKVASADTLVVRFELEETEAHHLGAYKFTAEHSASLRSIARSAADWLTRRRPVLWVEHRPHHRSHNREAVALMQSDGLSTPMWTDGLTGTNQVIGCGDSGLDVGHCSFADDSEAVTYGSFSSTHRKIVGYFTVEDADQDDDCEQFVEGGIGHGTHVAGSIAGKAEGSGAAAVSPYDGAAKDAKLVMIDMGNSDFPSAIFTPVDLRENYYQVAADGGAGIMSSSWGSVGAGCDLNCWDTNDYSATVNTNFLSVIAAGNSGDPVGHYSTGNPGTAKNALSVGASMNSNTAWAATCCWNEGLPEGIGRPCCSGSFPPSDFNENNMADFSSRGPTFDGRFKPELSAPGLYIGSARSDCQKNNNQCSQGVNYAVHYIAGTSMATPLTSGNVALLRQYWEGNGFANPTAALLRASALASTTPHSGTVTPSSSADGEKVSLSEYPLGSYIEGAGRFMPGLSLPVTGNTANIWALEATSTGASYKASYTVTTTSAGPLRIAVAWSDPPASILAGYQLVNDLDLFVNQVGGPTYPGNGQMRPAPKPSDSVNNFEVVYVANAPAAEYRIHVYGRSGSASQPFALVVSGEFTVDPATTGNECPNDCGPGTCTAGECNCSGTGFAGHDCSVADVPITTNLGYGMSSPFGWNYWSYDASVGSGDVVFELRKTSFGRGDPDLYCKASGEPDLATTPPELYDTTAGDVHYVRVPAPAAVTYTCGVFGSSTYYAPYTFQVHRCADEAACCGEFPGLCDVGDLRGLTAAPWAEVPEPAAPASPRIDSVMAGLVAGSLVMGALALSRRARRGSSQPLV